MRKEFVNPNKFNALKHGVSSNGLLPWEEDRDYALLETQWRRELRPHGVILEDLFAGIVRNRWLRQRNAQAMALFVACDPFGRAVEEQSDGNWLETARKVLSDLNANLKKIGQFAETLTKQAANTKNAAERKALIKSAEKFSDSAERVADLFNMAWRFFVGLGDEIRKQSDRDVDLDAKFNKQLTKFFEVEQFLATRANQLPQRSSSAGDDDQKSEPKGAHPRSEKKALPDPAKDISDDEDWGAPQKH